MAVLEDLLQRARSGDLRGFAFVVDLMGRREPTVGVTGTYRGDACRALGALVLMKRRLCHMQSRMAASEEATLGGGGFEPVR